MRAARAVRKGVWERPPGSEPLGAVRSAGPGREGKPLPGRRTGASRDCPPEEVISI